MRNRLFLAIHLGKQAKNVLDLRNEIDFYLVIGKGQGHIVGLARAYEAALKAV